MNKSHWGRNRAARGPFPSHQCG